MQTSLAWPALLERDVRSNPGYRLRSLDTLPRSYRQSLDALGVDTVAAPWLLVAERGSLLPDKVVDQAGADLFSTLREGGRMPPSATGRLAELVLDGVLEVDTDNGFLTGPLAYEALVQPDGRGAPPDRLGRLSLAALDYAERLGLTDVLQLTARLYCYHRIPVGPRWTRAYPGPSAVLELLRGPALDRAWIGPPDAIEALPWLSWTRRDRVGEPSDRFAYKLYVSPRIEDLPRVFPPLVEALTETGAARFKVGPDAAGLLRPDKLVVYLTDVTELAAVAGAVERALDGVRPHGVPFSAQLAGEGLLSWGGDPASDAGPVGSGVESWRWAVCRRLAESLVVAQAAGLRRARPADFALARLALDGVDVCSFAPRGLEPPPSSPVGAGRS